MSIYLCRALAVEQKILYDVYKSLGEWNRILMKEEYCPFAVELILPYSRAKIIP